MSIKFKENLERGIVLGTVWQLVILNVMWFGVTAKMCGGFSNEVLISSVPTFGLATVFFFMAMKKLERKLTANALISLTGVGILAWMLGVSLAHTLF